MENKTFIVLIYSFQESLHLSLPVCQVQKKTFYLISCQSSLTIMVKVSIINTVCTIVIYFILIDTLFYCRRWKIK